MSEDVKFALKILATIFIFLSFCIGAVMQSNGSGGCQYRTIASRVNIGYIVGCELAKKRW